MARLIYSAIMSLDGYIADAEGHFEWAAPDAEVLSFVNDLERTVGTYLYGRRMYETMRYWEPADAAEGQSPAGQDFAPFLFLGKQSSYTPGGEGSVTTWERDWKLLTGWKRWLLVAGAVHASFTDLALLAGQAGLDIGAGTPGARSLDITRAYVRAFFDQHLRGSPQPLLDQPSPSYPEVTFCSPA